MRAKATVFIKAGFSGLYGENHVSFRELSLCYAINQYYLRVLSTNE